MVLAGSGSLQRHAAGSAVHNGKSLVNRGLAGDNQGKLPCKQHHTGCADFPLCCFHHLSLRFIRWVRQSTRVPKFPFQPHASLRLRKIGNKMGHLSAMVP
jgi:hypothetical protein